MMDAIAESKKLLYDLEHPEEEKVEEEKEPEIEEEEQKEEKEEKIETPSGFEQEREKLNVQENEMETIIKELEMKEKQLEDQMKKQKEFEEQMEQEEKKVVAPVEIDDYDSDEEKYDQLLRQTKDELEELQTAIPSRVIPNVDPLPQDTLPVGALDAIEETKEE